jgi:hypothetical protein
MLVRFSAKTPGSWGNAICKLTSLDKTRQGVPAVILWQRTQVWDAESLLIKHAPGHLFGRLLAISVSRGGRVSKFDVSVIIPTYRREREVIEAINSALSQERV